VIKKAGQKREGRRKFIKMAENVWKIGFDAEPKPSLSKRFVVRQYILSKKHKT